MRIQHLNPADMHANAAYSQGVSVPSGARYVHVGGQNGVDSAGDVVEPGDLGAQTARALANLAKVLAAGAATPNDLISVSVYVGGDADIRPAFGAWQAFWGDRGPPPIVKLLRVAGFAVPGVLIELEALAAVVDGSAE